MKAKINLDSHLFQIGMQMMQHQVAHALNANQTVESAVLPIYALPKLKQTINQK